MPCFNTDFFCAFDLFSFCSEASATKDATVKETLTSSVDYADLPISQIKKVCLLPSSKGLFGESLPNGYEYGFYWCKNMSSQYKFKGKYTLEMFGAHALIPLRRKR
jgi:hypothetical protein